MKTGLQKTPNSFRILREASRQDFVWAGDFHMNRGGASCVLGNLVRWGLLTVQAVVVPGGGRRLHHSITEAGLIQLDQWVDDEELPVYFTTGPIVCCEDEALEPEGAHSYDCPRRKAG